MVKEVVGGGLGKKVNFSSAAEFRCSLSRRAARRARQDPLVASAALITACGTAETPPTTTAADTATDAPAGDTLPGDTLPGDSGASTDAVDAAGASTITEYVATLADFDCIKNGTKVGHFYVANRLGMQAQAVAVAQANAPGSVYPLGTIIRLFPLEAVVKRGKGFEATGGWEMFKLTGDGATLAIDQRGGVDVKNASGTCVGCHNPAKNFDFVCGTDHGCAPIPVTDDLVKLLQDADSLCTN